MSKTRREILQGGANINNGKIVLVDETKAKWQKRPACLKGKKLRPYMLESIPYKGKFEVYSINYNFRNTGNGARTAVRNANRSLKKGLRQRFKKEIKQELALID